MTARVSRPSGVDSAGSLEAAGVAAPVAAAGFAVPLGHAFPFFTVGTNGLAGIDGALEHWRDGIVHDRNDVAGTALRANGNSFLACGFFRWLRR